MLAAGVDEAPLAADVATLSSSPRREEWRKEVVRGWLVDRLAEAGYVAERQPFTISGVSGTNLLARGTPDARVLVAAHYDTVAGSPGADDDASGVAVVLELARALGAGATPCSSPASPAARSPQSHRWQADVRPLGRPRAARLVPPC